MGSTTTLKVLCVLLLLIIGIQDLQLLSAGAPCSSPDYWCHLSPNYYAQIEIGEDSPAKVVCTIPYTNGYDVRIINQFGKDVHRDRELGPVLREYVKLVMNPLSNPIQHTQNKSFHYEIYRPKEKHLQEQLSVIQCIGIMRHTRHPCRTSLINIQFTDSEDIDITPTAKGNSSSELSLIDSADYNDGSLGPSLQPKLADIVN